MEGNFLLHQEGEKQTYGLLDGWLAVQSGCRFYINVAVSALL